MKRVLLIVLIAVPLRAQSLPPGPAVPLMLDTCVQCHDFQWIAAQRKSEAAWRRTVSEMIWRGAPLRPGEIDVVTKYLVENFGDDARGGRLKPAATQAAATPPDLPAGAGRALVATNCVQCHDLAVTANARKTPAEWRQSVDAMVRLGAKLNGSESRTVARYLAQAFGR